MTGAVDLSQLQGMQGSPQLGAGAPPPGAAAGARPQMGVMDEKTNPMPQLTLPYAALVVETSRETTAVGRTVPITHVPFTLGRKQRDLNFNQDDNVSREHAEITFDGVSFVITDKNSTHHTFVDGNMIRPGQPTQLDNGATIRLGTTTSMKFQVEGYYGDSGNAEPGATRFS
jgi:pSer/pThr/pTyr-binding forkhead associated (FHA) protein